MKASRKRKSPEDLALRGKCQTQQGKGIGMDKNIKQDTQVQEEFVKDWKVLYEFLNQTEDACNSLLMSISSLRKIYGMKDRWEK